MPSEIWFPLLIWIDDKPQNNAAMVEYANEVDVCVVSMHSTAEAKRWIIKYARVAYL